MIEQVIPAEPKQSLSLAELSAATVKTLRLRTHDIPLQLRLMCSGGAEGGIEGVARGTVRAAYTT
jgi:hypothetical protein